MLLNITVTNLERLPNGNVLMTSGNNVYGKGDCISFEIPEDQYELKMEENDRWYADIDEKFFINLGYELAKEYQHEKSYI